MDEFEKAVLLQYEGNNPNSINAKNILEKFKESPNAWKECLNRILNTQNEKVNFYCLQVIQEFILHKYLILNQEQKIELKQSLIKYLSIIVQNNQTQIFLKNKLAQTIVLLFREEYNGLWTNFFDEMFSYLSKGGLGMMDMFLRIMDTVDECIASKLINRSQLETAKNSDMKDFMRNNANKNLFEAFYSIINTFHQSQPGLAKYCLKIVSKYINWVNISLIINDKFTPLILNCFKVETLQKNSAKCIEEIILKGMPPLEKIKLITTLNLIANLKQINTNNLKFLETLARIVDTVGISIIEAINEVERPPEKETPNNNFNNLNNLNNNNILNNNNYNNNQKNIDTVLLSNIQNMLNDILPLLYFYLSHEDFSVSLSVQNFAQSFVNYLKPKDSESTQNIMSKIVTIIVKQVKYPPDYQSEEGDYEGEFLEVRASFSKLLLSIGKAYPLLITNLGSSLASTYLNKNGNHDPLQVEVTLVVLSTLCEVLVEKRKDQKSVELLTQVLTNIILSDLLLSNHTLTKFTVIEIFSRFYQVLPSTNELLSKIIQGLVSENGILNENVRVRRRSCYCFSRIVSNFTTKFEPFISLFSEKLRILLVVQVDEKNIHIEDQNFLFDALGKLLGSCKDFQLQTNFMQQLIGPLFFQLQQISSSNLPNNINKQTYNDVICRVIEAAGTYSKGFKSGDNGGAQHVKNFFKVGLEYVMVLLQRNLGEQSIREKCVFFLHRMVELLREDIFSVVEQLAKLFLYNTNPPQIIEFLRLIGQIMNRMPKQVENLMKNLITPILSIVLPYFKESGNGEDGNGVKSEEKREINDLKKCYFVFLENLIKSNLSSIVLSNQNILNTVMGSIKQGCLDYNDTSIQSICLNVFKVLTKNWLGTVNGFDQYFWQQIFPVLVCLPFDDRFDLTDGKTVVLLKYLCDFQTLLSEKNPVVFEIVSNLLLNNFKVPKNLVEVYLNNLKNMKKTFFEFYEKFMRNYRAKTL